MDTLYACALKRTPCWLAIVVSILPAMEFVVGIGTLITEFTLDQNWVTAIREFYIVFALAVNMTTYDLSGFWLIRILRNHQPTGAVEEVSGSKSPSRFDAVISRALRSMFLLSMSSLSVMLMYLILGIGNCNTEQIPPYDPTALGWNSFVTIFVQLVLGLLFTRFAWVTKAALTAEIMASVHVSSQESDSKLTGSRLSSRVELREVMARLSQSPKSPHSEGSAQDSQAESEVPVVAVTVEEDPGCDQARCDSGFDQPQCLTPASAEIVCDQARCDSGSDQPLTPASAEIV